MNIVRIINESKNHPTDLVAWLTQSFDEDQLNQIIRDITSIKPSHPLYRNALLVLGIMYYKGISCEASFIMGDACLQGAFAENDRPADTLHHKCKKKSALFQEHEYRKKEEGHESSFIFGDPHLRPNLDNIANDASSSIPNYLKVFLQKQALEKYQLQMRKYDAIKQYEIKRQKQLEEQLSFLKNQLESALKEKFPTGDDSKSMDHKPFYNLK